MLDLWAFYMMGLWRRQPMVSLSLLLAVSCAGVAVSTMAYWDCRGREARAELSAVLNTTPVLRQAKSLPPPPGTDLPAFDSARFTSKFQATARELGVRPDEIFYVLEGAVDQPYLRYRIEFEMKSGYLEVRKLLAALSVEQPHVVLDTIRCQRENAGVSILGCQLAFSAFFRKVSRG